ncbi:hypothetical protein NQD34_001463 [Periophthalmus magnuspinnatus]|nr:hypothetical protein NQD34_001463 [Periophthalmus magnuspinnatus]
MGGATNTIAACYKSTTVYSQPTKNYTLFYGLSSRLSAVLLFHLYHSRRKAALVRGRGRNYVRKSTFNTITGFRCQRTMGLDLEDGVKGGKGSGTQQQNIRGIKQL